MPVTLATGITTHKTRAMTETTSVTRSNRSNETGRRFDPIRINHVCVKLGTMRPPIKMIRPTIAAMPTRLPILEVPDVNTSAWNPILAAARNATRISGFRLRQLRPTTISRATTRKRHGRKRLSSTTAGRGPVTPVTRNATRAAHQRRNRRISRHPATGRWPVQLGTMVKRNPATTAAV